MRPTSGAPHAQVTEQLEECLEAEHATRPERMIQARALFASLARAAGSEDEHGLEASCTGCVDALDQLLLKGSLNSAQAIDLIRHVARALGSPATFGAARSVPDRRTEALQEADGNLIARMKESRLGEVLLQLGLITPEQLDRALVVQRVSGKRLGEALVSLEALDVVRLMHALSVQRDMTLELTQLGAEAAGQPPVFRLV